MQTYHGIVLWECSIECEHLWRCGRVPSIRRGGISTVRGVIQGDLLPSRVHGQYGWPLVTVAAMGRWAYFYHHLHLKKQTNLILSFTLSHWTSRLAVWKAVAIVKEKPASTHQLWVTVTVNWTKCPIEGSNRFLLPPFIQSTVDMAKYLRDRVAMDFMQNIVHLQFFNFISGIGQWTLLILNLTFRQKADMYAYSSWISADDILVTSVQASIVLLKILLYCDASFEIKTIFP